MPTENRVTAYRPELSCTTEFFHTAKVDRLHRTILQVGNHAMSTNLYTDSFTYTRSHKHAACLSIFSGTCNDPVLIIAHGPPQCRIIHTPPIFLAVYGSSVLDVMHKKGKRNILSRKRKQILKTMGLSVM